MQNVMIEEITEQVDKNVAHLQNLNAKLKDALEKVFTPDPFTASCLPFAPLVSCIHHQDVSFATTSRIHAAHYKPYAKEHTSFGPKPSESPNCPKLCSFPLGTYFAIAHGFVLFFEL